MIDGFPVPAREVHVIDAAGAEMVVLASDGYPILRPTLAESETALKKALQDDPLMCRGWPSTKGLGPGRLSCDDRSYIRFTP